MLQRRDRFMAKKKAATKTVKKPAKKITAEKPAEVKAEPVKAAAPKKAPAPKKAVTQKAPAAKKAEPKTNCIFKAIETGDLASFMALLPAQKDRKTQIGRTPLMLVSLILSNPRLRDGSNYEIRRNLKDVSVYKKMQEALIAAKCNMNAMDVAGNTARDYMYGGYINQMLAD